jgi:hypothetical protein
MREMKKERRGWIAILAGKSIASSFEKVER